MLRNDNHLDRRSVLKTVGSAAAAGIGLAATGGTAGAVETTHRLERAYSDERRLRIAFQQHGEGLRQTLVDEEIVADDFDFDALDFEIDEEVNGLEAKADDRSATVTAHPVEGQMTAIGVVTASTETHDVRLYVQPERDEAYAIVEPEGGDQRFIATESDFEPSSCGWTECTTSCCSEDTATKEYWECYVDGSGNCTECFIDDTACSCHDCASCDTDGLCPE